jgi:hypothetical protein
MELLMFLKFKISFLPVLIMIFFACGGRVSSKAGEGPKQMPEGGIYPSSGTRESSVEDLRSRLEEIAALERAGSWFQGMGLTESGLRESLGDYSGAVAAAYKELSWALGRGLIKKEEMEQGILNLLELQPGPRSEDFPFDANNDEAVRTAAKAVLAFARGQWAQASAALAPLFDEQEEPDGFGRWMLLVCVLENNREDRRAIAAYKAIRARYVQQPEYWYRGARAFSGAASAEYAENCINLSPQGPFADECRRVLAAFAGLKSEDGASLKTKTEIEEIITRSVNTGNPQVLDSLFPLIGLADNPYTVFAVGALKTLSSVPKYRDFFNGQAAASKGRLAERLSYICRG